MTFTLEKAFEIKKHYESLIGTPLTPDSDYPISGIFICHQGNAMKAVDIIVRNDFDERFPLLAEIKDKPKDFEIYVYHFDGASVFFDELDSNINEKGIQKIYAIE